MSQQPTHAKSSDLVGTIIGHYMLEAEIATGGMGTVYRAKHELIDRVAAVKLLRPEFSANPEMVERFFNEARAASAIRHPGIVEVLDFGFLNSGHAYLVMEFLEGPTLATRIAERKQLSEVECAALTRSIVSALGAAHNKGITHRDLKPDNIILVADPDVPNGERAKVLDFGIAKLADDDTKVNQTRTGTLMGTPAYMAPEQARAAGEIDPRADLYAVGCMMYEMLTGSPPFTAVGAGELIALQLFGIPEPLRNRLPGCSIEIHHIVMKLLEKEPSARYQTASELLEALSEASRGLTTLISSPLATSPTMRHSAQRSIVAGVRPTRTPFRLPEEIAADDPAPTVSSGNRMGLFAGLATVALVAGIVAFVVLRKDPDAATVAPVVQTEVPNLVIPDHGSNQELTPQPVTPIVSDTVAVFFVISPKDAQITIDGTPINVDADGIARLPRSSLPMSIAFGAPGYELYESTLVADRARKIEVTLDKVGRSSKRAKMLVADTESVPLEVVPQPNGSGSGPVKAGGSTGSAGSVPKPGGLDPAATGSTTTTPSTGTGVTSPGTGTPVTSPGTGTPVTSPTTTTPGGDKPSTKPADRPTSVPPDGTVTPPNAPAANGSNSVKAGDVNLENSVD